MSDFELFVGGVKIDTFINGWVKRQLDTVSDSFEFQFADLRTDLSQDVPVRAGEPCFIKLDGRTLLTGYVDDVSVQYNSNRLTLTARGRSKTSDLVDCSAVRESGRWRKATIRTIVQDLCDPFGLDVQLSPNMEGIEERFSRFAIEPGETAADAIQRACRLRAVWATCTVDGDLLLTRAGLNDQATTALEYGENIISGERFDSWARRHNLYLLKGQVPSDDEFSGKSAAQISELISDEGLDRYRPLLLVSTGQDRKGDLRRRAQWERNRRAGSGERWLYRVDGYGFNRTEYVGPFASRRRERLVAWEPNQTVRVNDPRTNTVDQNLLVSSVSFRWQAGGDDGGRTTDLGLNRREAFSLQTYPARKRKKVYKLAPSPNDVVRGEQGPPALISQVNFWPRDHERNAQGPPSPPKRKR